MADQDERSARKGRQLLLATVPFAKDSPMRSWWDLGSTLLLLAGALLAAGVAPWWPGRALASVLAGLLMVRVFVLYHDYMHEAVLRGSRLAQVVFHALGVLLLTPPRSWRSSHNFHHAHVGTVEGSSTGSFPILTVDMWRQASRAQRLRYRISRSPLTIALAYLTVFVFSICVVSFLKSPRRNWDALLALAVHAALLSALWAVGGVAMALFVLVLPMTVASALGAYLFYAQHNFVGMRVLPGAEWSYYGAALASSSYLRTGRFVRWITGNIGYHHVHHLNPHIPSYNLPAAMAAIPELQRPVITTLRLRDIRSCLRLKLWDTQARRMLGFAELERLPA
jgi:omega-6 fatty acid desaturase (delta-12 desaturase)